MSHKIESETYWLTDSTVSASVSVHETRTLQRCFHRSNAISVIFGNYAKMAFLVFLQKRKWQQQTTINARICLVIAGYIIMLYLICSAWYIQRPTVAPLGADEFFIGYRYPNAICNAFQINIIVRYSSVVDTNDMPNINCQSSGKFYMYWYSLAARVNMNGLPFLAVHVQFCFCELSGQCLTKTYKRPRRLLEQGPGAPAFITVICSGFRLC